MLGVCWSDSESEFVRLHVNLHTREGDNENSVLDDNDEILGSRPTRIDSRYIHSSDFMRGTFFSATL